MLHMRLWKGQNVHCPLWLHVIDTSSCDEELLSESPSRSSSTPPPPTFNLCSLAVVLLTHAIQTASRPKRPPLTEAPETQRSGRAHRPESPVRLAAAGRVSQSELGRWQTPHPQESHVRREAAEHRRWALAPFLPKGLLSVLWLKNERQTERMGCY